MADGGGLVDDAADLLCKGDPFPHGLHRSGCPAEQYRLLGSEEQFGGLVDARVQLGFLERVVRGLIVTALLPEQVLPRLPLGDELLELVVSNPARVMDLGLVVARPLDMDVVTEVAAERARDVRDICETGLDVRELLVLGHLRHPRTGHRAVCRGS